MIRNKKGCSRQTPGICGIYLYIYIYIWYDTCLKPPPRIGPGLFSGANLLLVLGSVPHLKRRFALGSQCLFKWTSTLVRPAVQLRYKRVKLVTNRVETTHQGTKIIEEMSLFSWDVEVPANNWVVFMFKTFVRFHKTAEHWWLGDDPFPFGFWPIFRGVCS